MKKTTYLSSIISALNKLNGMGSLNEIYKAIEEEVKIYFVRSTDWVRVIGN